MIKDARVLALDPGCRAELNDHYVEADLSLRMSSSIVHYNWDWDARVLFPGMPAEIIDQRVQHLRTFGSHQPHVKDIQLMASHEDLTVPKSHFWGLTLFVFVTILVILTSLGWCMHRQGYCCGSGCRRTASHQHHAIPLRELAREVPIARKEDVWVTPTPVCLHSTS